MAVRTVATERQRITVRASIAPAGDAASPNPTPTEDRA